VEIAEMRIGPVVAASGAVGFVGESYWHHRLLRPLGLDFTGSTPVMKSTNLKPIAGNAPLRSNFRPREHFPRAIYADLMRGVVANAWGHSGPGLPAILASRRWQEFPEPFVISLVSDCPESSDRLEETREMVKLLKVELPFRSPVAIEYVFSCGNVGLPTVRGLDEIHATLEILRELDVPLGVKLSIITPVSDALEIASDPNCAFLGAYNALPDDAVLSDGRTAREVAGFVEPPLVPRVGVAGSYSGAPFFPYSLAWHRQAREAGITKPMIVGLGIMSPRDAVLAYHLVSCGGKLPTAVAIGGAMAITRPWKVRRTIHDVNGCVKR